MEYAPVPTLDRRAGGQRHPALEAPSGGHFMAFEEPRYVADHLTAFMREVG